METVNQHCPACNSTAASRRGDKNGYAMFSCQNCGTLYTPCLAEWLSAPESLYRLYDNHYDGEEWRFAPPTFVHQRLDEIVNTFAAYRKTGRLLDVGCGDGTLMQAATRASWQTEGTEVSHVAVEHARRFGLQVFEGTLEQACYPAASFDVVTASEVFEHVTDPRALVQEIKRVLRPGGLLWATTPHGKGFSARAMGLRWSVVIPPEHLQLFSVAGLRRLLTDVGFSRTRIYTHAVNPTEIIQDWQRQYGKWRGTSNVPIEQPAMSLCDVNAAMMRSAWRRRVKEMANVMLDTSRLGDALKVYAEA